MKICSYLRLDLEWNVYPGTHIHTHSDTPRHTHHTHTHPDTHTPSKIPGSQMHSETHIHPDTQGHADTGTLAAHREVDQNTLQCGCI